MNSKRTAYIVVIILFVGLFLLNRRDVTLTEQDNFALQTISPGGVELQSVIHLNNPNLLSSTIKNIHEKFYVNGTVLGIIDNELNQGIPGMKTTSFPITIRFAKSDLNKALQTDSITAASIKIDVEGEITFSNLTGGGSIKIHTSSDATYK